MELFRIIKSDAKRAMRFCGGRTIAAMFAVVLALIAVNLTETVFLLIFAGPEAFYSDIYTLAETYPAVIPVLAGSCVLWLLLVPAIIIGYLSCGNSTICFFSSAVDSCLREELSSTP